MMKRVGVPRLAGPDDQPPLIIATGPQIQQQGSVAGVHTQQASVGLHDNPSSHQTTIIVSTQQVINYSKGALQYAGAQYPAGAAPKLPPGQVPHMAPPIQPRHKGVVGSQSPGVQVSVGPLGAGGVVGGAQFQRLKVEDALSYLDQVKYKFNNQPQVYNDFLDIMKEFKSQSIDTPGVIARVSNLFKGHPELIVGFNTFLPPGYKIEVQANDQGYAYQVSVSMPSPNSALQHQQGHNNVTHAGSQAVLGSGATGLLVGPPTTVQTQQPHPQQHHLVQILPGSTGSPLVHTIPQPLPSPSPSLPPAPPPAAAPAPPPAPAPAPAPAPPAHAAAPPTNTLHHISQAHQQLEAPPTHSAQQPVEFNHAIEYVNKIKNRFNRQPEKYKRFLEILHAYQRGQKELKEPQVKQQTEQEVYAQVAKLFENQDDLLLEFGQFLPDATGGGGGGMGGAAIKSATAALDAARPGQEPIRPRAASQALQRSGVDTIITESDSGYSSVPARPASPVGFSNSTLPVQVVPPRQQEQPPSSQVSSNHHQKHSSSSHHTTSGLSSTHHLKRSPSFSNNQLGSVGPPPPKKHKLYAPRDVSYAEAAKYGTLSDFSYFDRVRKALRSQEVYDNFLRCLLLFTNEIISKSELLAVTAPFFTRHPELQRWMQEFLGPACGTPASPPAASPPGQGALPNGPQHYATAPLLPQGYTSGLYSGGERYTGEDTLGPLGAQLRQDRPQGDAAMEVDLTTCKRLGTSYCALPRGSAESAARRCSGRTALCREVLNDSWVSFPTWAEDSTFVTSRKTQYEEYIYRCEDERFELDVVIETNASTILALEGVHKKLCRMSAEDAARFRMDDCLGGSSPTIHQRALRRIYGEKVAPDIIAGLKKNPLVAVPVVLRRLKAKEEEWREAQKGFNKQWREQNEKYYLKSLDHQGINFKQNDLKSLRSKSLINEIETLFEERREQLASSLSVQPSAGPQLCARLGPGGDHGPLLADAADLLIHHVRRQTAVQKQEKQRIKQLLKHFLPDLFSRPRVPLSDDERDDDDKELDVAMDSPGSGPEDRKPARGSSERDPEPPPVDPKPVDNKISVKQEREVSSESDSNTGPAEKATRRSEKLSNRENKENLKTMRNNSAEDIDNKDAVPWSKSSESSATSVKGSGRRREGSSDSSGGRVKVEPPDTTPATDITISALPPLYTKDKWNQSSSHPVVFLGSSHWYVFLRLHSVLCQRLSQMKALAERLAREEAGDARLRKPATATALRLKPDNTLPVTQYYSALLEMVRSVLDGNMEASAYEDGLREMFGIHAFVAFTLDKIVSYAVRQLQQCVQERLATKCVELHVQERARSGSNPSPAAAAAHQRRAERLLREEHAFKMCIYGGDDSRVTFELLESGAASALACSGSGGCSPPPAPQHHHGGGPPVQPARLADWTRYRERYANPADTIDLFKDSSWIGRKAVFLQRNVRRFQRRHAANGRLGPSSPSSAPAVAPDGSLAPPSAALPAPVTGLQGQYVNEDRTECKFTLNSYTMVFVVNKEQFLYKKDALSRARKSHPRVTLRMDARWQSWLRKWCARHVTPPMARGCQDWLKRGSRAITRGAGGLRPPYRPYTAYGSLPPAPL